MKKETYLVELVRPHGVSITEMSGYIKEAVETWAGSFRPPASYGDDDPGNPLFPGVPCKVKRLVR
jgi:hypothetical protein